MRNVIIGEVVFRMTEKTGLLYLVDQNTGRLYRVSCLEPLTVHTSAGSNGYKLNFSIKDCEEWIEEMTGFTLSEIQAAASKLARMEEKLGQQWWEKHVNPQLDKM